MLPQAGNQGGSVCGHRACQSDRVAIARRKPSYTRGQFNKVLSMLGSRQWAARALVCGRPRARRSGSRWNKNLSDGLKW